MKFSLVFENTLDSIPFQSAHPGLIEYYVDGLNKSNDNIFTSATPTNNKILQTVDKLFEVVQQHEDMITVFGLPKLNVSTKSVLLDPAVLNKLHADWVNSKSTIIDFDMLRRFEPDWAETLSISISNVRKITLVNALQHLGLLDKFEDLNKFIHIVERNTVNNRFSQPDIDLHKRYPLIKNIFGESVITNNLCNLKLVYSLQGRSLYDKYINHDFNLEFDDENNYKNFSSSLSLNFSPAQTIEYSAEYVMWCKRHNRIPTGNWVNLGNLINYNKIAEYRKIYYRNLVANNTFSIQLAQGELK